MLVFVLLVSMGLSWLAVAMKNARTQREAVEAIRRLGGEVEYDDELDRSGHSPSYREPAGPVWVRNLLGCDFVSGIFAVVLDNRQVEDADLQHVASLRRLQCLSLRGTKITDAGLEHLKGLTQLRLLNLRGTVVTDAGLRSLKDLRDLRVLDVGGTQVTDAGLEHLAQLPSLGFLYVEGTAVTRAGVKTLRQALPRCEVHDDL